MGQSSSDVGLKDKIDRRDKGKLDLNLGKEGKKLYKMR